MDYEEIEELNNYYIAIDHRGRVVKTFSDVFMKPDFESGRHICIGSGHGSQFVASTEVLSDDLKKYADIENGLPLINEDGIFHFKYENGLIDIVSSEELQSEKDEAYYSDVNLRLIREFEFKLIDKYQLVLVYDELSQEQKAELQDYRQKWLDITNLSVKSRKTSIPQRPNWIN